ncbi:MAG: hypothetical protein AB7V04_14440 [Desulfomonilaceae bacterium]
MIGKMILTMSLLFMLASSDIIYLDKNNNYMGFSRDSENSIDFYDRKNMPAGWYDKSTNTMFDRHNRPSMNIYDLNRK